MADVPDELNISDLVDLETSNDIDKPSLEDIPSEKPKNLLDQIHLSYPEQTGIASIDEKNLEDYYDTLQQIRPDLFISDDEEEIELDLGLSSKITNVLVPTDVQIESDNPADILANPNVNTIIPPITQEPFISPVNDVTDNDIDFSVSTEDDLPIVSTGIDQNKIMMTDDEDVILAEPDNMQVEEIPFTRISEGIVELPPEENMEVIRTKNIVLKRKNTNNEIANVKKRKTETNVTVRGVVPVQHPIYRRLQKILNKNLKQAKQSVTKELVRIKTDDEIPPTVDISTINRLPWVDFDTILDNAEYKRRAEVILNILQNNLPPSENDIYYIYHDPETNTYSIEVDENIHEIQDYIQDVLTIDARLRLEDLSSAERAQLKKLKKK